MEDFIEDENVRSLGSGQHIASLLNVIGMACHIAHREQSHFEIEQYLNQFLQVRAALLCSLPCSCS
jgi:hypothetical protein